MSSLLDIVKRLIKWDTDFPVNCYNGYAGLKELDRIIADGKKAVSEAEASFIDELGEIVPPVSFQGRVHPWMLACFGAEISADCVERCDRFIEEALELTQAVDYSADRAHALVDYVFGRDVGEPHQEVGGVMVTLAALCLACDIDMDKAAEDELARIWTNVEAIRAKQAAKPTGSALPVAAASQSATNDGWMPTHRHKKRGSTYTVIAEGRLQVDGDLDYERVVIYRDEDGQVWARPKYEFEDGRFEAMSPARENRVDQL